MGKNDDNTKNDIKQEEDIAITAAEVAELFGLSVRRIQGLTKEGVLQGVKIPKIRGKRYLQKETVRAYVSYLSDKVKGKSVSIDEARLKKEKLKAETELKESQKELHQLKTDIFRGKYIPIEEVELDYRRFFTTFKKFADAIPPRVAVTIGAKLNPTEARELEKEMADEINEALKSFTIAALKEGRREREEEEG